MQKLFVDFSSTLFFLFLRQAPSGPPPHVSLFPVPRRSIHLYPVSSCAAIINSFQWVQLYFLLHIVFGVLKAVL